MATLENLIEVSDSTFNEQVLGANLPVLVFFWSGSCSGCTAMKAPFEQHSAEYTGRMRFATYSLDNPEERGVADTYFRKAYLQQPPVMMLFKGGKFVGYAGGCPRDGLLESWIERLYRFL